MPRWSFCCISLVYCFLEIARDGTVGGTVLGGGVWCVVLQRKDWWVALLPPEWLMTRLGGVRWGLFEVCRCIWGADCR